MNKKTKSGKNDFFINLTIVLLLILLIVIQIILYIHHKFPYLYFLCLFLSIYFVGKIFNNFIKPSEHNNHIKIKKLSIKNEIKENSFDKFKELLFIISFFVIIIFICVSFYISYIVIYKEKTDFFHIPLIFQIQILLIAVFLLFLYNKKVKTYTDANNKYNKYDFINITILFFIIIILRFYKLGEIPAGTNIDEVQYTQIAHMVVSGSLKFQPFIESGNAQFGGLAHNVIALFFEKFGISLFSLRILPALSAIPLIIFFYLLLRFFFDKNIAFLSSLLFACDHNFLHTTRWMHIPTVGAWLLWACFFFLIISINKNNCFFASISGALTGLALYLYNTNKLLPILLIFYIIYEIIINKIKIKNIIIFFIAFIISMTIVSLPLIIYVVNHPVQYFTYILDQKANNAQILSNISTYLKMFTIKGTRYGFQNYPLFPVLDIIPATFFIIGIVVALYNFKNRLSFIAIICFIFGLIPGITSNFWLPPNHQRSIIAILASFIFISYTIAFFYKNFNFFKFKIGKWFLIFIIIFASLNEIYTYFFCMQNNNEFKMNFSPIEYNIGKIFNKNKDKDIYITKYFIGGKSGYENFIGNNIYFESLKINIYDKVLDISNYSKNSLLMFKQQDKDVKLIAESFYVNSDNFLKKRFPNIIIEKIPATIYMNYYWYAYWLKTKKMWVMLPDDYEPKYEMIIYTIPKKDIQNISGFYYFLDNNTLFKKNILLNGLDEPIDKKGFLVGKIKIYKDDFYSFKLAKDKNAVIFIDNKFVNQNTNVFLFQGLHSIKINLKNILKDEKLLIKTRNENDYSIINSGDIFYDSKDPVFVKFYYVENKNEIFMREENAPDFLFKWRREIGNVNLDKHVKIKCVSKLIINEDGIYEFINNNINSAENSIIKINNKEVYVFNQNLIRDAKNPIKNIPIYLKKGLHNIEVIYEKPKIGWWSEILFKNQNQKEFKFLEADNLTY